MKLSGFSNNALNCLVKSKPQLKADQIAILNLFLWTLFRDLKEKGKVSKFYLWANYDKYERLIENKTKKFLERQELKQKAKKKEIKDFGLSKNSLPISMHIFQNKKYTINTLSLMSTLQQIKFLRLFLPLKKKKPKHLQLIQ